MSHYARVKTVSESTPGTSTTLTFDEGTPLDSTHIMIAFFYTESEQVATPAGWSGQGSVSTGGLRLRIVAKQGDGSTNSVTFTSTNPNSIRQGVLLAFPGFVALASSASSATASGSGVSASAPAYSAATTIANLVNISYAIKNAAGAFGVWDSSHDTIPVGERLSIGVEAFTSAGQNPTPGTSWAGSATYRVGQMAWHATSYGGGSSPTDLAATVNPAVTPASAIIGTVLTSTPGTWNATPDSVAYQWRRGATSIPGEISATYTVTSDDVDQAVTCQVTATKAGMAGGVAVSNAVTPTSVATVTSIQPSDANILYSPGNWDLTAALALTVNSGAYFRVAVACTASSVALNFDTSGVDGQARLQITVDGEPALEAARAASVNVPIPANGWSTHTIEVVAFSITGNDLWTSPASTVKFTGLSVASGSIATRPYRARPKKIICFGDSITNGYATTSEFTVDARVAWAYPLGDILGAEVGVVGFNAQGFSRTGSANIPLFGSTYDKIWSGTARSWTGLDLVIINMGTNDGGTNNTAAMTTVLNGILTSSTAKILVVQQWSGTAQRAFWQSAIAACTTPSRVTYLDTTGWWSSSDAGDSLHPWGYINLRDLAPRVAAAAAAILSDAAPAAPARRYLNIAGTPTPISG